MGHGGHIGLGDLCFMGQLEGKGTRKGVGHVWHLSGIGYWEGVGHIYNLGYLEVGRIYIYGAWEIYVRMYTYKCIYTHTCCR